MTELEGTKRRRATAKQRVVLETLGSSDTFRSAQQLHMQLQRQQVLPISLTSVYRILRGLAEDRIAETQRAEDGEILYRMRNSPVHRHYLLCRRCGEAVAFTPLALEQQTSQLSGQYNYTDVTHHVDLYGICPRCRALRP